MESDINIRETHNDNLLSQIAEEGEKRCETRTWKKKRNKALKDEGRWIGTVEMTVVHCVWHRREGTRVKHRVTGA